MIKELNTNYGSDGHIRFEIGQGGLAKAIIYNNYAEAEVYLHGGHVTHFQPHNQAPVIWMSKLAQYQNDVALRGGIPICWPWFGPHPTDGSKPQHGFARVMPWSVVQTAATDQGETVLQLRLVDSEATRSLWNHAFQLDLTVTVGATMQIALTAHNIGSAPFAAGAALHTYFHVGNVDQIQLTGLDGCDYLDKVTGYDSKRQNGAIRIASEVDRIYLNTEDAVVIEDESLGRKISVAKAGSRSTVVWNPWSERAAAIGDFPDDGYETMVCVETANAATDVREIKAGESHTLTQIIVVD